MSVTIKNPINDELIELGIALVKANFVNEARRALSRGDTGSFDAIVKEALLIHRKGQAS